MAKPITLTEYLILLRDHDWYYHYSDDPTQHRKGADQHNALVRHARYGSDEIKRAYNEWHERYFNTPQQRREYKRPYVYPFPEAKPTVVHNDPKQTAN